MQSKISNLEQFSKQTITSVAKPGKTIMLGDTMKGKLNSSIKRIGRTDPKLSRSGLCLR